MNIQIKESKIGNTNHHSHSLVYFSLACTGRRQANMHAPIATGSEGGEVSRCIHDGIDCSLVLLLRVCGDHQRLPERQTY
jgi:hypothetical protein